MIVEAFLFDGENILLLMQIIIMNEQIRKEIEKQRHYEMLMYRYRRLKNLPFRRLRSDLIEALYIEQICNFFGRTLKTKYKQL